jgi:hypothetical protein
MLVIELGHGQHDDSPVDRLLKHKFFVRTPLKKSRNGVKAPWLHMVRSLV